MPWQRCIWLMICLTANIIRLERVTERIEHAGKYKLREITTLDQRPKMSYGIEQIKQATLTESCEAPK